MRAVHPAEPGRFVLGDELVECHSGYEYPERPVALHWQGERLEIKHVDGEWCTPEGKKFRVRTKDGQVFDLSYRALYDEWRIEPA